MISTIVLSLANIIYSLLLVPCLHIMQMLCIYDNFFRKNCRSVIFFVILFVIGETEEFQNSSPSAKKGLLCCSAENEVHRFMINFYTGLILELSVIEFVRNIRCSHCGIVDSLIIHFFAYHCRMYGPTCIVQQ